MGALEKQCKSINNVIECLELGFANQHFGLTNMNDRSSRSHTLLSLTICENINANFSAVQSKIHFVDLAGSERVEKTGNIGNRLKESVYINSGLLALGNVIHSLTDKRKAIHRHIPYRQSKITRLLKDSLGGNSHTLMICCISPASSNIDETLNSLKYASRARHIKNKPILNFSRSASANVTQIEDKMPEYIQNERAKTVSLLKMKLHSKNKEKTYIDIHQESLLKSKLVEKNREMQNLLYKMGQQKILIRDMAILIDQNVLPDSMKKRIHNFSSFCNTIKSNNDDLVGQFKVYQSELHKNDYIIEKKEKESNGIVNSTKAIDSARPQCDKKVVPKETLKNFDNEKPVLAINENTKKNSNGWKFSIPNHLFSNSEKRENEIDKKNKCFVSKFLKNKIESYQDKTQHIDTILFSNLPELTTDYRKFLFNEFVKNSVNTIHDKPNSLSHSDLVESNHINDSLDDFYQNTNFESTFTRNSTNRSTFKKIVNKLPKIKPEKNASQPKKSKYIIDNQGHKKEESFVTLTDSFDNMNVNSTIDISCNGDNSDQENTKLSISQLRRKIKNIGRQIDRNYNRKTKLLCSLPSIINPSKKHENSNGKRRKNEITESTAKIKKSLHV